MQQQKLNCTDGTYQFNYVTPGEIRLRVIEDTNGNGQWDTGNVVERLQPERAEMYFNEKGEDLFTTKANWDMEIDMDMSQIFQPMTMQNLVKMLDDKETSRLKKLYEEYEEKRAKEMQNTNQNSSSGMGGMGGMMGGLGGMMGGNKLF